MGRVAGLDARNMGASGEWSECQSNRGGSKDDGEDPQAADEEASGDHHQEAEQGCEPIHQSAVGRTTHPEERICLVHELSWRLLDLRGPLRFDEGLEYLRASVQLVFRKRTGLDGDVRHVQQAADDDHGHCGDRQFGEGQLVAEG